MSWFQPSMKVADARNQASAAEIVACFRDEGCLLTKLAFLITEDQASADRSVDNACEVTLHGNSPFRDWLLEWGESCDDYQCYLAETAAFCAIVKPHTSICAATMSSTHGSVMLPNGK